MAALRRAIVGITASAALVLLLPTSTLRARQDDVRPQVHSLKITILSTMLAGEVNGGIGEWGFAALVDADGRRILFDTGARPETVNANLRELGLDLVDATDLIISHNHADHTGGLLTLRRAFAARRPSALSRAHVGHGIFWPRPTDAGDANGLLPFKVDYEKAGGTFVEHDRAEQIAAGVWVTGPVPRLHPERNWRANGQVRAPDGIHEDTVPEDMSLIFDTPSGLVVLSGCGHAGIINTLEYARKSVRDVPIHAAIGGFHLFAASDEQLAWTAEHLRRLELQQFIGAHCTGMEALFRIRQQCGLTRATAIVGSVGATFTLGSGIRPTSLAQ
jgi:7,8-dihydropterin-6-yl-methyl-4-(beta-D-ribofuranosyl)aminobenzene 5'-phosphate synthase